MATSKPLTERPVKAVYYPVDYSSTDLADNLATLDLGINGMCPVIANVSVPSGRKFSIEVCINYEVTAKYSESDLFS